MSNAVVTLKKGEGRALKAGGAWIFDNEIASLMGSCENGDLVFVHDFDGKGLFEQKFKDSGAHGHQERRPGD